MRTYWGVGAAFLLMGMGCAAPAARPAPGAQRATEGISGQNLMSTLLDLSSDEFEGRAPGTRGEEKTVAYLTAKFKAMELEPGNPDGSFRQAVPLVGFTSRPTVSFSAGGRTLAPSFPSEFVAVSRRASTETAVADSEVVFVGYGVQAPEYHWDDYKGLDVRGKTLLMLINDPAVPNPRDPMKLDERVFKGAAMTYYGRWTYKYEIASALGAAAAIIIHETEPAGYPYEVVSGSFGREQFDLRVQASTGPRVAVEAWVSSATARAVLALAGQDLDHLKAAAIRPDFKPVPLGVGFQARVVNEVREIDSANVVAAVRGSDFKRRDEWVVYTAHWDHLGKDNSLKGDRIYNGAVDNASGVAALVEIAGAFKRLSQRPARSILFLATTAEEKGLLGAQHYVEHPLYPLANTVAELNMDSMQPWGPTSDLPMLGLDLSTLDRPAREVARAQQRDLTGDPMPEKGLFFRSDHFPFAKAGVPALDLQAGVEVRGETPGWGRRKREEYTAGDYHKPSDEAKLGWDPRGMAIDSEAMFRIGLSVADAETKPDWKPGVEFKAARDRSLKKTP